MDWQIIISPPCSGKENMAVDTALFDELEHGAPKPTIRIYRWSKPCISFGYSQKIESLIDIQSAEGLGWDIVKRPTGGGIVFHNKSEVTYSIIAPIDSFPKGHISIYKFISQAVVIGLNKLGVKAEIWSRKERRKKGNLCFAYPAEYEIVVLGKKIVGAAQKWNRTGFLQEGSIFVKNELNGVANIFKKSIVEEFNNAISLDEILGYIPSFEEISSALILSFEEQFKAKFLRA